MNLFRIGLVGTGYVAKLRAETLLADPRAELIAVAGHSVESATAFSQNFQAEAVADWQALVDRDDLDLVIVSNINCDHGTIVQAALQSGKHVVVEYPLALDIAEAEVLVNLAKAQGKLLHVEHIELLGGVHQALVNSLPAIGSVFHARYATLSPQHPAPQKWTYHPELFGFPLSGALSRLHRLTHLFGAVENVHCFDRYWQLEATAPYYSACICSAQLRFQSGVLAEVTYGKGEAFWQATRIFEVQGEKGTLIFDGDEGWLVQGKERQEIEVGSRRGLFAKDTIMVLDHLTDGKPLYLTPEASLYTLKVADAARRSAESGQVIAVSG
jgi:biliverdin reductase